VTSSPKFLFDKHDVIGGSNLVQILKKYLNLNNNVTSTFIEIIYPSFEEVASNKTKKALSECYPTPSEGWESEEFHGDLTVGLYSNIWIRDGRSRVENGTQRGSDVGTVEELSQILHLKGH